MSASLLAPIVALLYLAATALHVMHIFQHRQGLSRGVAVLGGLAILCHSVVAVQGVSGVGGLSLGFYRISALMFLAINLVCVLLMLRRPLQNLLVVLFPLSAMSVLVSTFAPETAAITTRLPGGMLLHIGSSILAYAVLTLAAAQSALVAAQDYQLRHRHTRGIVQILPPLQLMETMLFELLLVGVILLTVAIVSGFIFIDDIFAQHLVHKTVLTMLAWVLFSVLLWGHYRLGWRSQLAVRLTLAGFAALMLAFFGSKLVLEVVLQRG
ncbi:cytochrome C biogenesis protein [Seongchinamella sediminis]|uniref:Cytochrome C biogenesis protein n=1 Tax=Seongchinamella sediminis TaxID=2283635 RepID=A0A3L7DZR9_9GAMM|nr:cytochrome c biogenesis protein CcsA [Seongchinamella sediminis]RLQ22746.1 cytochrome C biogenesis protein [Seongchinamella sediminis]